MGPQTTEACNRACFCKKEDCNVGGLERKRREEASRFNSFAKPMRILLMSGKKGKGQKKIMRRGERVPIF